MNSPQKTAKIAGWLYLLMGITGAFGLMYVPSQLIVSGNATATANNIMAHELLFRFGIMSNFICQITFVFLALTLYHLFKGVDKLQARLMVAFVIVSIPITFLNSLNQTGALIMVSGDDYLKAVEPQTRQAIAMLFLNLYDQGIFVVGIFWGLWLFPFGMLIYKSKFLPKFLGVFLMINCFAYLIDSATILLFPDYHTFVSKLTIIPMSIGELSTILWLLIMGIRKTEIPS